jgi:hypothetical protein
MASTRSFTWQGTEVRIEGAIGSRGALSTPAAIALLSSARGDTWAAAAVRDVLAEEISPERTSRLDNNSAFNIIFDHIRAGRVKVTCRPRPQGTTAVAVASPAPLTAPLTPPPARRPRPAPPPVPLTVLACSNPVCEAAFAAAALSGIPLVERGGPNC